jgi:hypothetical protein
MLPVLTLRRSKPWIMDHAIHRQRIIDARLDAYDGSGALIEAHPVATGVRALYPCRKPKDYGYGLIMCP